MKEKKFMKNYVKNMVQKFNFKKIPRGKISFSPLKAVGTDCIHGDADDFVQLDTQLAKKLK